MSEPQEIHWRAMESQQAQIRLGYVLESWRGTPYMPGQCCKGVGVDCVRFVVAVLDELAGVKTDIKTIAPDAAVHSADVAQEAFERLIDRFDCSEITDGFVEPGDVLATGPLEGGPGHAVIVGSQRRMCWDAVHPKVRQISLGLRAIVGQRVFNVYRMNNRKWGG